MSSEAAAQLARHELEGLLRRGRRRFPEPLESLFQRDYFDESLRVNRAAFAVGLLILAGFGVVDLWATRSSLRAVWILRFGVGCPAVIALLGLSFSPVYRRIMQPASSFVAFLVGLSITGMVVTMRPRDPGYLLYIFGITPVLVFTYIAPRLQFRYATAAGWAMVLASLWIGVDQHVASTRHAVIGFALSESFLWSVNLIGMLGAHFIEAGTRHGYLQRLMVRQEQARAESLLLSILPAAIAERLKRGESVVDSCDEVSVLFADIVDFTALSATVSARELVSFLNSTFSLFDRLAEKHGLEKIKTIGDAYMVVGGVPEPRPDHVDRIADMALEMQEEIARVRTGPWQNLQLRIGLNTGPVVAGVIGLHKFSYDLWGDTVNTASRMESHGSAGRIQVTEEVHQRLGKRYTMEGPHEVAVKGKGSMRTYFLTGKAGTPVRP